MQPFAIKMKIWVRVKPQAKREEMKMTADGELTASVCAPAREGKANEARSNSQRATFPFLSPP